MRRIPTALSPGLGLPVLTIFTLFLAVWFIGVRRDEMCQLPNQDNSTTISDTGEDYCPNVSLGETTCGRVSIGNVLGNESSLCGNVTEDPCHSHVLLPDNSCEAREKASGTTCTSACWASAGSYCQAGSCVGPNSDCYGYCPNVLKVCGNDTTHGTACGCPVLPFVQSPDGHIGANGTLFNSACMYNSCRYGVMYFYQNTSQTVLPSFSCLELLDQSSPFVQTGCIQAAQVSHNYMDYYSSNDPTWNYQWIQTCTYWFACAPYNTAPYAISSIEDLMSAAAGNNNTNSATLPPAWYRTAVPSKIMPVDTRYRPAVAFMYSQLFNFNFKNFSNS